MSPPAPTVTTMTPLTAAVIAFERLRWNHAGAKEQAVHDLFGLSATRYYQARNALLDDPQALVLDAPTVNRLRRLRDSGRRRRTG